MKVERQPTREMIKIVDGRIHHVDVVSIFGKQGDYFIEYAPSICLSGYGLTEAEARESFELNMELFYESMNALSIEEITEELQRLGFSKETVSFHQKNTVDRIFSKEYQNDSATFNHGKSNTTRVHATI